MELVSDVFRGRKPAAEKLSAFGFQKDADGYRYETEIMDGDFLLTVRVRTSGTAYSVRDRDTGEDYEPLAVEGWAGSYVPEVRHTCEEILKRISDTCFYDPASVRKKHAWIIPSNLKIYDIVRAYRNREETGWRQYRNFEPGDVVYIYVGVPYKAILYRCEVEEAHLPDTEYPHERMRMRITDRYAPGLFTRDGAMKQFGVTNVRGPRSMPREFEEYIRRTDFSLEKGRIPEKKCEG